MARTSASHPSSTAKRPRKPARTQHRAAGPRKSLTKASNAHAQDSARDLAETESRDESDFDSTLDRTSNDLGDIERPGSDPEREDSDIERAVESDPDREGSDIERAH